MGDEAFIRIPYSSFQDFIDNQGKGDITEAEWACFFCVLTDVDRFQKTRDPVDAAVAFASCVEWRVYPPDELLAWVGEAFRDLLSRPSERSDIPKAFGFKVSRGQTPPFINHWNHNGRHLLLTKVAHTIFMFDLSVEVACEMVVMQQEWLQPDIKIPAVETVIAQYYRQRKPQYKGLEEQFQYVYGEQNMDDLRREELLEFPTHAIPSDLKKRFSIQ